MLPVVPLGFILYSVSVPELLHVAIELALVREHVVATIVWHDEAIALVEEECLQATCRSTPASTLNWTPTQSLGVVIVSVPVLGLKRDAHTSPDPVFIARELLLMCKHFLGGPVIWHDEAKAFLFNKEFQFTNRHGQTTLRSSGGKDMVSGT